MNFGPRECLYSCFRIFTTSDQGRNKSEGGEVFDYDVCCTDERGLRQKFWECQDLSDNALPYTQNWGRLPKIGLGLVLTQTSCREPVENSALMLIIFNLQSMYVNDLTRMRD